jgi:hypothetical protein
MPSAPQKASPYTNAAIAAHENHRQKRGARQQDVLPNEPKVLNGLEKPKRRQQKANPEQTKTRSKGINLRIEHRKNEKQMQRVHSKWVRAVRGMR